jgi:molecular chaperone GrpE
VRQQALSVLAELGFPRRDDAGRAFDPALHEAVGTIADEELVPGQWPAWYAPDMDPTRRSSAPQPLWWPPGAIDGSGLL